MLRYWMAIFLVMLAGGAQAMTAMTNEELDGVSGQALIVLENIKGVNVTSGLGTGNWSDFTYTRMGLDARLSLNANMDKLQLGCGGFNEVIRTGCDVDLDYVRFMGRNGTNPCAMSTDTSNACYGGGNFVLTRPYVEIATKGNAATREVVGIKVGAQQADGYMGIGRNYTNGQTNLENGGSCNPANAGAQALACHSGINTVSGYLHTEMSARIPISITLLGSGTACFGNTSPSLGSDDCGVAQTFYRDIVGTRVTELRAPGIQLQLSGGIIGLLGSGYADVTEALRFVHGFAIANTNDFFISFQRERISYPGYAKTAASYAYPANAGWWMNVPDVKAVDIAGPSISLGLGAAIDALSSPGVALTNIELNSVAPSNCWGNSRFC